MGHYRDCIRGNALRYRGYECQVRFLPKRHIACLGSSLQSSAHYRWSLICDYNT